MPKTLRFTNVSIAYLTGNCNNNPSIPKPTDEEPLIMDEVAWSVGTVAIVVYCLTAPRPFRCPVCWIDGQRCGGKGAARRRSLILAS